MATREFTIEQLEEEIDVTSKYLSREIVDERRWYDVVQYVFHYEGKYWRVNYMSPATELQEDQDRWHSDPVIATEVRRTLVEVTRWVTA